MTDVVPHYCLVPHPMAVRLGRLKRRRDVLTYLNLVRCMQVHEPDAMQWAGMLSVDNRRGVHPLAAIRLQLYPDSIVPYTESGWTDYLAAATLRDIGLPTSSRTVRGMVYMHQ
jgi:hypothetical protein